MFYNVFMKGLDTKANKEFPRTMNGHEVSPELAAILDVEQRIGNRARKVMRTPSRRPGA